MNARRDALVAAARLVLEVERLSTELGICATSTVGFIENHPNTTNTISALVRLTAEIRDVTISGLERGETELRTAVARIAGERLTEIAVVRSHRSEPAQTAPFLREAVEAAAATVGARTLHMSSAAGHDAQIIAGIAPVGMIFVPSRAGVSHQPDEDTDMADLCRGANVLLAAVADLVTRR